MYEIKVENLTKKYGKKEILKNVNISIDNKRINFLIGENGIGKTTFVKCLKGAISYEGYINNNSYKISYSPDKVNYPDFISVYNFLFLLLKANGLNSLKIKDSINEYLKKFEIYKYRNTPIIKLSKGSKQKISLIQALIQDKEVYIFDEPLNGIDDKTKNVFLNEITKLLKDKKLILIITHQIEKFLFNDINIIDFNKHVKTN